MSDDQFNGIRTVRVEHIEGGETIIGFDCDHPGCLLTLLTTIDIARAICNQLIVPGGSIIADNGWRWCTNPEFLKAHDIENLDIPPAYVYCPEHANLDAEGMEMLRGIQLLTNMVIEDDNK